MANKPVPLISVIIPAYNAAQTIEACLQALRQQDGFTREQVEIIVVDDASTDDTAVLCQPFAVILRQQTENRGAGAARNAGLQIARGGIICFTDADCTPAPSWLTQITRPFTDPEIDGCKGIYATRQRELTARFVQLEYEDKYDLLRRQPRIDFIDTYSAAYRRPVLLENGGFDERFHYTEDQELSFRLAAQGCQFVFQPNAVVFHRHSRTLPAYARKKFWIGYWKWQTVRRFPDRALKDSHTPQVMKVQMGLMAQMLAATAVFLFSFPFFPRAAQAAALLGLIALLAFLASTLPFLRKAWPKDRPVALISPFLLAVRAAALGFGTAWGMVRGIEEV
jgi:glycosyltransferase involved in cell wall biosynthesis